MIHIMTSVFAGGMMIVVTGGYMWSLLKPVIVDVIAYVNNDNLPTPKHKRFLFASLGTLAVCSLFALLMYCTYLYQHSQ